MRQRTIATLKAQRSATVAASEWAGAVHWELALGDRGAYRAHATELAGSAAGASAAGLAAVARGGAGSGDTRRAAAIGRVAVTFDSTHTAIEGVVRAVRALAVAAREALAVEVIAAAHRWGATAARVCLPSRGRGSRVTAASARRLTATATTPSKIASGATCGPRARACTTVACMARAACGSCVASGSGSAFACLAPGACSRTVSLVVLRTRAEECGEKEEPSRHPRDTADPDRSHRASSKLLVHRA